MNECNLIDVIKASAETVPRLNDETTIFLFSRSFPFATSASINFSLIRRGRELRAGRDRKCREYTFIQRVALARTVNENFGHAAELRDRYKRRATDEHLNRES